MSRAFSSGFAAHAFDVEYDMTLTATEIITAALIELRVLNATDAPSGEDLALGLLRLNTLIDAWNAERQAIFAEVIQSGVLTPGASPHTIGPSGHIDVSQRPASITSASFVLSDGSRAPIGVHHGIDWWAAQTAPTETGEQPTDLCYVPDYPLGAIYFWPVPTAASTVELTIRSLLDAGLEADTDVALPQGYPLALILTLAEELAPAYGGAAQLDASTIVRAAKARARIFNANLAGPRRMATMDAGMPGGGSGGWWDYHTGSYL